MKSAKVRKHFAGEKYTPERKAEFLLSTAISRADYIKARKLVQKLGIDPESIPHRRPAYWWGRFVPPWNSRGKLL